jgi:hypothetical protein
MIDDDMIRDDPFLILVSFVQGDLVAVLAATQQALVKNTELVDKYLCLHFQPSK